MYLQPVTIQILLQRQHATYSQQALLSMCSQPYSLKMLWAPIVDSMYVNCILFTVDIPRELGKENLGLFHCN